MTAKTRTVSYHWRLRQVMAAHEMYSTTELLPHLEARGVVLSREQVYRLVAKVPERLSLTTLAALCDIFACSPADLIGITTEPTKTIPPSKRAAVADVSPLRAKVARPKS
ncbi:MAG: helix-turn-helix domain-containing protein [Acidimicrobiales bacterium]